MGIYKFYSIVLHGFFKLHYFTVNPFIFLVMKTSDFLNFVNDFTGKKIKLLKPENNLKYAAYYPYNGNIEPLTKYGVFFDGRIVFDFVTGKNEDNFFKTFVTQYINKYQCKQMIFENGELIYPTKNQCIEKIKNADRVNKNYFYTTLYGIGVFCYFMRQSTLISYSNVLSKYLESNKITFKNEFSEAGWVYRFVIKKDVETHNEILTNFNF